MNLRLSLRYFLSVLVSFCIVFSSSFCGIARASTTEQSYFLMNRAAASSFDLSLRIGTYNMRDDSFDWSSSVSKTSTSGALPSSMSRTFPFDYNSYTGVAVEFSFSDIPSYSDLRVLLGRMNSSIYIGSTSGDRYYLNVNGFRVISSFANYNFTGSIRNGNTHFASEASSIESISSNFLSHYSGLSNVQFLLDASLSPEVPDVSEWENYYENDLGNEVTSSSIDSFKLTFVFAINDAFKKSNNSITDNISDGDALVYQFGIGDNVASISGSSYGDSTGIGSLSSSISNSISSMGDSLSSEITQVKTQITNSTKTITTKIDTMSTDIQTGLQNVVESAQQNTQNIINTVTSKVDELKTGITQVKDSILDLPNKISEMLIGLVVPDEQAMIEQKEQWDTLLAERFGVVYESVEVMDTVAGSFTNASQQSTITLPSVTVPLANEQFTFGGYNVEVVPEGFGMLADALKLIIDIVVTLAFINAMKNRYEQLVSR